MASGQVTTSENHTKEPVTEEGPVDEESLSVHDHLELALQVAADQQMSTSELLGIFFYYTHNIAESYRQEAIAQHEQELEG